MDCSSRVSAEVSVVLVNGRDIDQSVVVVVVVVGRGGAEF